LAIFDQARPAIFFVLNVMGKKGVNYSIKKEFLTGKIHKPVDLQGI